MSVRHIKVEVGEGKPAVIFNTEMFGEHMALWVDSGRNLHTMEADYEVIGDGPHAYRRVIADTVQWKPFDFTGIVPATQQQNTEIIPCTLAFRSGKLVATQR